MTYSAVLEAMLNLCVQVSVLICVAAWLTRCARNDRIGDQIWRTCHVAILLLTAATFLLPNARLATLSGLMKDLDAGTVLAWTGRIGQSMVWIWLSGFLLGCGALLLSTSRIRKMLRSSNALATEKLLSRHPRLRTRLPDGREIQWRVSDMAAGPFCWQIHQPIIVLPNWILEFDDHELAAVLDHETCHLISGHPLSLFLQRMTELTYWFHPIVWWGSWQAAQCREVVCDHAAARSADEAAACLRSLLKLAERGVTVTGGMPAGLNFGAGRSLTQTRALRLSEFDTPQAESTWVRRLPLLVLITGLALSATRLPLDAGASDRSSWSPWPTWTSAALQSVGISTRDYEVDNHRFEEIH